MRISSGEVPEAELEKNRYLLPRSIRKTVPHADSHAQSSAGGFTQHKHLPNEERGGANLKKKK